MLVFLDLETSGLDPTRGFIMEAAALVVDEQLVPVQSRTLTVDALDDFRSADVPFDSGNYSWADLFAASNDSAQAAADVERMHTTNGLIAEIESRGPGGVAMCEEALLDFLVPLAGQNSDFGPLCGYGVSRFDRPWIVRHMPKLAARFSYQDIDVRTLQLVAARFADEGGAPEAGRKHRALPDCYDAVEYLSWFRQRFLVPLALA